MKKTFWQGIINVLALCVYLLFVLLYSVLSEGVYFRPVAVIAFLVMISIILYSKYILYHRQNMLYFLYLFLSYALLVCIYINNFEILLMRDLGLLLIIPAALALVYYLVYQEMYQLYFGMTTLIVGGLLLIIF